MVLECVMICVDNSEYMRNGDYQPSRLQAQNETVQFIATAKIDGNAETHCGLLTMAGEQVSVLVTPNREVGQIMTQLAQVEIAGSCNFLGALKTAQLALKNRKNKLQRQRIIMFVGSPVEEDEKQLTRLAKKFKKNSIAVDIVCFGTEAVEKANTEKLRHFIDAVKSNDENSHLVEVGPGPHMLSNMVLVSPIMNQGASSSGGAVPMAAMGGPPDQGDSEFQMALRASIEDERKRVERERAGAPSSSAAPATPNTSTGATPMQQEADEESDEEFEDDEDALARAMALSMGAAVTPARSTPAPSTPAPSTPAPSTAPSTTAPSQDSSAVSNQDIAEALADKDFVSSLLEDIELGEGDVDIDDLLSGLNDQSDTKTDTKKTKKKDNQPS